LSGSSGTACSGGSGDTRRPTSGSRSGSPRAGAHRDAGGGLPVGIPADARLARPPIQATGSLAGDHGRDCVDGAPSL
jgi:hypothetical protein